MIIPASPEIITAILSNYHKITTYLQEIAKTSNYPVTDLMIVTKNQPENYIIPLLEAGHRFFGENRVQEAVQKWPTFKKMYPDIRLHLIGPLQRNKVHDALELFDNIETIDREKLIDSIMLHLQEKEVTSKQFIIQVNIGQELQKSGVLPIDLPKLIDFAQKIGLPIQGLMCIPPVGMDPTPYFKRLKELSIEHNLPKLSMGMSNDYPLAIALGSSWVRVGSDIFNTLQKEKK